jgi:hypothetical protein
MNKTNRILAVVLVVQLVLLAAINLWPHSESKAAGGALVADFAPDSIMHIQVTGSDETQVALEKTDNGGWVLPAYDDFPVNASTVTTLLSGVQNLTTDRLITESASSHRRLKVADDEYERLVELTASGGATTKLYLGSSGSGSTIYVRLDGEDQVYLQSGLSSTSAPSDVSRWVNTLYFNAASDQITSLTLTNANGSFDFTKAGEGWTMAGLADGETLNQDTFSTLLSQVTALRLSKPLGKTAQHTYGMDAPQAVITLHVMEAEAAPAATEQAELSTSLLPSTEEVPEATIAPTATPVMVEHEYTITLGAALDDGVVAKASNSDYYVLLATTVAGNFTGKTRADLVTAPPVATDAAPESMLPGLTPEGMEPVTLPGVTEAPTAEVTEPAATLPTTEAAPESTPAATELATESPAS